MRRMFWLRVAALVVVGVSVGLLFGQTVWGITYTSSKCKGNVTCPPSAICHAPPHCGYSDYHKCTNGDVKWNTCGFSSPTDSCTTKLFGCMFQMYTPMCGSKTTGPLFPCCYKEC